MISVTVSHQRPCHCCHCLSSKISPFLWIVFCRSPASYSRRLEISLQSFLFLRVHLLLLCSFKKNYHLTVHYISLEEIHHWKTIPDFFFPTWTSTIKNFCNYYPVYVAIHCDRWSSSAHTMKSISHLIEARIQSDQHWRILISRPFPRKATIVEHNSKHTTSIVEHNRRHQK